MCKPDEEYYEIINKSDVAPMSKITNIINLKKLVRCSGKSLDYIIYNPDEVYPIISDCFFSKNTSESSLFTSIGSMMSLIKWSGIKEDNPTLYNKWSNDYFKPLSKRVSDIRESNEPTQRQKDSMISWSHVLEKYNYVKKTQPYSINHVFLAMCVLIPVRRQADYSKVLICRDKDLSLDAKMCCGTGWIDMYIPKPAINIIVYKTSKNYKKWTKELPHKLFKIINKSLLKYPREYLIVDKNNNPWNSVNSFTQHYNRFLKKIFDNNSMSLNALRHSYAGHLQTLNLSVKDRKTKAMDMGHSYTTNMTYVLKNPNENKKKKKIIIDGKKFYITPVSTP